MSDAYGAIDVLYQPAGGTCASPADALAEMDAAGVATAMVSQCKQWTCERQWMCVDTRLEDVARYTAATERFVGMGGYNPFDVTESMREMEAARALGFRATYLDATSYGVRLTDARLYPLFAKCSELSQAVVLQLPLGEPRLERTIAAIGQDFPELQMAIVYPRPTPELLRLCERIDGLAFVLDTAALVWLSRQHAEALHWAALQQRCMWGSNGAPLTQTVREARAECRVSNAVLRDNALRYFSRLLAPRAPQALAHDVVAAER